MARAKGNTKMKLITSSTDRTHLGKDGRRHAKDCTCARDQAEAAFLFFDLIERARIAQRNNNGK